MSSRRTITRGRRNRASKLPVVEEPQFDQKRDEPQGSKFRKSKNSPAGPSHVKPETVAVPSLKDCVFQEVSIEGIDYSNFFNSLSDGIDYSNFFNSLSDGSMEEESVPSDDDDPGAKAVEPKIATTPHEGADLSDFDSLCDGSVEEGQSSYKGTTTVAVIGSDAISIAADGRGTSTLPNKDGLILLGKVKKIVKISDKIVLTLAGSSEVLFEIVKIAKKSVIGGSMIRLWVDFKKFKKSWRKNNGKKKFPASILICGWSRGKKTIIKFGDHETTTVDKIDSYLASGWGEKVAEDAVKSLVEGQNLFSSEEYVKCVSQAITESAMGPNYTGGKVMTCIVDGDGVQFQKRKHVLELLSIHYTRITRTLKLTETLICTTLGVKYSYRGEREVVTYLRHKFGHHTVQVIAVRCLPNVIIRLMRFSDAQEAHRSFVSVAGRRNVGSLELSHTVSNVQFKILVLKPSRESIVELWERCRPFDL